MNDSINRRNFIKQTGTAGLGLSLATGLGSLTSSKAQSGEPAKAISANDRITAAVIGTNSRGLAHIACLTQLQGVEITYICDVDDRAIAKDNSMTMAYLYKGGVFNRMERYSEALACYEQALKTRQNGQAANVIIE